MKNSFMNKIFAVDSTGSAPEKKKSRRTLIVAIVILLIIVLIVGIYIATMNNAGNNNGNTPTATPTTGPSSSSSPTAGPTETGSNVAGASSLQYTVEITDSSGGSLGSYTYYAKNAGTSNLMLRIESTGAQGGDFIYIINGAQQKAWLYSGGQWTDLSSAFQSTWDTWNQQFTGYIDTLGAWSGTGNYIYADPNGDSIKITNISVNPSLPDSLFVH
jgi:hypothetical protein